MVQYGSVIGNQARQLFGLVERILLFAATRQGHQRYNLRALDVQEAIDAALANAAGLIEAGHFTVEREIEPESAASNCGCFRPFPMPSESDHERFEVRRGTTLARHSSRGSENGSAGKEIQISVSDRGIGISAADLPHIFEPFYRSPSVRAAQIHGTGLGLPLSQSLAEAMNGRLTVSSARDAAAHLLCICLARRTPFRVPLG